MATVFSGEQAIEALYVGYFGRAGDPSGTNYWVGQLNAGLSISQIAASFAVQPEATSMYSYLANPNVGGTAAQTQFINQVYQDLFNHAPDAAGLAYYSAQLTAANGNPQAVGQFIINVETGAQGTDATILQNKVTVAQFFTDNLATSGDQYNGSASAVAHNSVAGTTGATTGAGSVATQEGTVTTYISGAGTAGTPITLTTGVDTVTGPNLAISGVLAGATAAGVTTLATSTTLNVGDQLNPTGGNNSLNITSAITGGAALTAAQIPTLTNIQTVNVNNVGAGTTTVDFTGIAPALTTIGASGIDGVGFQGFNGTQTHTFSVSNISAGGVTESFTAGSGLTSGGVATGSATLNLSNVAKFGSPNDTVVTVAGNSATDGFATLTVNSNGSVLNELQSLTDAALKTLNIAGTAALTVDNTLAFAGGVVNIQAATDTGGLTIDVTNGANTGKVTFVGGSGVDSLTVTDAQLLASGTTLNGGTGTTNTLVVNEGTVATGASMSASDYSALTTAAKVTGFSTLGLLTAGAFVDSVNAGSGGTTGLAGDYNSFALASASAGGYSITNLGNNATITELTSSAGDVFQNAFGATTINVNIGIATSTGLSEAETLSGWTTVNLASNGTGAAFNADAVTLNASASLVVTGSNALDLTLTASGPVQVNAAAETGVLFLGSDMTTPNVLSYHDTVVAGTTGNGDTIALGSGANVLIEQTSEAAATTNGDTITLLAGHAVNTIVSAGAVAAFVVPTTGHLEIVNAYTLGQDQLALSIPGTGIVGLSIGGAAATEIQAGSGANAKGLITTTMGIPTAAAFLGDLATHAAGTVGEVYAYTDGTNTYVAEATGTATGDWHVVELAGVVATKGITLSTAIATHSIFASIG